MTAPESLDPAIEDEWRRMRAQLDLADGFWLGFAFLASPAVARTFEQRTERLLRQRARRSTVVPVRELADADAVVPALLSGDAGTGCVWVDCVHALRGDWDDAIWRLFLRLNERRDALRRRLTGGLVFALHPSAKPLVRDAAPDLWSVRSIVLEPAAVTLLPPPRDEREYTPTGEPARESGDWAPTRVSSPELRAQLDKVARRLGTGEVEDAVAEAARALALVGDDTPPGDLAAILTWASRAEEAADDDGAATDHAERALALLPQDATPLRRELLTRIADLAERRQDLDTALPARHALVELARARLADRPDAERDAYRLRELSSALIDEGDASRDIGDLDRAHDAYAEALRINRRILAAHGETAVALRDLSVSLKSVGDTAYATGDFKTARDAYTESLTIDRRILTTYGETRETLRDLSVSLDRVGDTARAGGDLNAARDAYTESLTIRRRILTTYGETPQTLRDLSISLTKVGDTARDTGDLNAARDAYTESLTIARRILTTYGETPQARRDLAQVLLRVADVAERTGNAADAQAARAEAEAITEHPG